MRNQTSFRLTTTLLPNDTTANTTTVINKLDSSGNKFYPTFTEETVVLTNDDRTIMETTRATCTNWTLTFVKRGLSDDVSATPIENRKLTWNPWTLAFITAWAWDWIDKDDDVTWTGDQTYTGDLNSYWKATYNWLLETKKWVKYPSFTNVAALEAYANPFGWMFATVDSTGELYRYNAVTEERALIESSTPANPEMADDETIWTVRIATDAEFEAWTDTGSQWEYLVATPSQIKSSAPANELHITNINSSSDAAYTAWTTKSVSWTVPRDWFLVIYWQEYVTSESIAQLMPCNDVSMSWTANPIAVAKQYLGTDSVWWFTAPFSMSHRDLYVVTAWEVTATITCSYNINSSDFTRVKIDKFFYFG